MDRRVKERLVGAAILVAVVVLVVPELLSGPPRRAVSLSGHDAPVAEPRDPMRTVTVDLSQTSPTHAPTPEPAPPPASPVRPAVVAPALETPRSPPKSATVAGKVEPVPVAQSPRVAVSPQVAAAHGAWAVQLGSFKERANALKLARHWKSKGYPAYLSSTGSGSRALHRVRIGPYPDRDAALAALAALASDGERANLVAPGR